MSQYNNKQRAAALRYSEENNHAPIVVAAGAGYTATKIIEVAQDNNVPVYQDDALASLLSQMNIGTEIPQELYQAVADLYLYFLKYGEPEAPATVPSTEEKSPSLPEMPDFSEE